MLDNKEIQVHAQLYDIYFWYFPSSPDGHWKHSQLFIKWIPSSMAVSAMTMALMKLNLLEPFRLAMIKHGPNWNSQFKYTERALKPNVGGNSIAKKNLGCISRHCRVF